MILEFILNASLLGALCVLSAHLLEAGTFKRSSLRWVEGLVFGWVAVVGMKYALEPVPGLLFDARSIVLGVCAWFFGWPAALVSFWISALYRLYMGGAGAVPGLAVIFCSSLLGLAARLRIKPERDRTPPWTIYAFGMGLSVAQSLILPLMFSQSEAKMPPGILLPIVLVYPLVTLLVGSVLADKFRALRMERKMERDRKRMRRMESRAKAMVAASPLAMLELDPDGKVQAWNPAAEAVFGWSVKETLGRVPPFVGPGHRTEFFENLARSREGRVVVGERRVRRRKDGANIHVELSTSPVYDESNRVCGVVSTIQDISKRVEADTALRKSLEEKDSLLREVHHRVKNNLQVINSLLNLESRKLGSSEAKEVILEIQNRVRAMALLHESVYKANQFTRIDMRHYLRDLAGKLIQISQGEGQELELRTDLEPVLLELDQALPAGLLVNELLTNVCKHGFPANASGAIRLELKRGGHENELLLTVADQGRGVPEDWDWRPHSNLGLKLVEGLARQLHGTADFAMRDGWFTATISFYAKWSPATE